MTLDILIDTGIFSIPPYADSEDDVLKIINRISYWSGAVLSEPPFSLSKLSGTEEALWAANCISVDDDFDALFSLWHLHDKFDVNGIVRLYWTLLSRTEIWVDRGLEATECTTIDLVPNVLLGYSPPAIVEHSKLVYANSIFGTSYRDCSVAYVASGLPLDKVQTAFWNGKIHEVTGGAKGALLLPLEISGEVALLTRIEDAARCRNPIDQWRKAKTPQEYYAAICLGCIYFSLHDGNDISLNGLKKFTIGSEFTQSLINVQAIENQPFAKVVFETVCRVILGEPKYPIFPMGKPSVMHRSDGASAWRTHVTSGNPALRLMGWSKDDYFEIANVGPKKELYIADGDVNLRYTYDWN